MLKFVRGFDPVAGFPLVFDFRCFRYFPGVHCNARVVIHWRKEPGRVFVRVSSWSDYVEMLTVPYVTDGTAWRDMV